MYNIIKVNDIYYDLFGEYLIYILDNNDMFLYYKRNNNIITLSLNQCKDIIKNISNYVKVNYLYLKNIIDLKNNEINLINIKKYSLLNLFLCSLYQLSEKDIIINDDNDINNNILETIICILDNLKDEIIIKLKTIEDYNNNCLDILYNIFENVNNIQMITLFNYYLININNLLII